MNVNFTVNLWILGYLWLALSNSFSNAQTVPAQTNLIPSPRQAFTPTPQSVKGFWNIDVVGDFYLPKSKSITFCGAGRNLHVAQDWQKIFRRGFSSVERGRMTADEIGIVPTAKISRSMTSNKLSSWTSRLAPEQRALILYQNYFIDPPFNLAWGKNSEFARSTFFEQPSGSATPRESLGNAMSELSGGCVAFNDCPGTGGQINTFGKIFFDIENDGTSGPNQQEHANLYVYKTWALRKVVSPYTEIGGIMPTPHNSHGYSRTSDYTNPAPEWLWTMPARQIDATNTRGRGMPDAIVGKSFSDLADFQMPGTYFLSSDFDYAAVHTGDEDRHWLASLLGEQEVNMKLSPKKRIAWQWLFNTQSTDAGQAARAEHPAPPVIAEGMGIFYWFTGAYGTIFWDDWADLTPNAPVVPGRENLDNNRNYACYEHYIHGLWRLFKHNGDLFNGQEKYLNEQTECSYDNGQTWLRLNANGLKQGGLPFARAIVNGDEILIAATKPYASPNQQSQVMVRYVEGNYRFYTTINLKGDEIFLGRARMPTGTNTVPPSTTAVVPPPVSGGLTATVISYNCATGSMVLGKTGGANTATEFSAIGITGWTTNPNHTIEAGLRSDPKTMTIHVRQNGQEGTSFAFDVKAYCSGTAPLPPAPTPTPTPPPPPPNSGPVNPPTGGALLATVVSYNCATGSIVLGKTGGANTATEFSAIGITGWTTNINHTIEAGLRSDPKTMTIRVRQNGQEGTPFAFDVRAYCSGTAPLPPAPMPTNTAPTVVNNPGSQVATVGTAQSLNLGGVFTDIQTPNQLALSATGLPAGLTLSGNLLTGTPSFLGAYTITLRATDPGGLSGSLSFVLTVNTPISTPPTPVAICGSPANTIGQPLQITGITDVNCQTGAFRITTRGGNGSSINFANIVGLNNTDQANCLRVLDNPDMIRAINTPGSDIGAFQIRVMQGGTSSPTYTFNFKQHCTGVARVANETQGELRVVLLGNPTVDEWAEVEVHGTNNEPVSFRILEVTGKQTSFQQVNPSGNTLRQRLWLGRSGGLLLVQVSTPTRIKTVKIIRQ